MECCSILGFLMLFSLLGTLHVSKILVPVYKSIIFVALFIKNQMGCRQVQ